MSDASTKQFLTMYRDQAQDPPAFLSGFFRSPPENYFNGEKVEIDVVRDDENIAIPVPDLAAGARRNELTKYVNKGFTPPVFKEELSVSAHDLVKRQPGNTPYGSIQYDVVATEMAFTGMAALERKIHRSVELMASQIFANGAISFLNETNDEIYELDFKPKSTHFVNAGAVWAPDGSTGNPLQDIFNLAVVVRRDGKKQPTKLVFGATAIQRFLANPTVLGRLDNRNLQLGQIAPVTRGQGATFMGYVWVGNYRFEIWMYDGQYKDPATGNYKPYVADDHVLMLSDGARLDLAFGNVPFIARPEQRALAFLPRFSLSERGVDLIPNAWVSQDGLSLTVQVSSRPLPIPTAIDTFGRIDVVF